MGDLHVTATLGKFPQLLVASASHPAVLAIGLLLFIGGLSAGIVRKRGNSLPATNPINSSM